VLSKEEYELLTRVGPGTPMGELLRRHWAPALLSWELPEPDCPPVRISLLGEPLVAFRDSTGQVGLLAEHCAHRGASLYFGRNEECGLRCVYHGWKYDVHGNCVDMPNEPPESSFKERIHHTAYPCTERAGVIWTYMGPRQLQPGLPELEWNAVPESHLYPIKKIQECNWFQAMEGGVDTSHITFLHSDKDRKTTNAIGAVGRYIRQDGAPRFEVVQTPYGMMIGAKRRAEEDSYYYRITQWLLPWYTMIPPFGTMPLGGHAWVPIDDEHTWSWSVGWHPERPLTQEERADYVAGERFFPELVPGTFHAKANKDNDYLIDRERQRSGTSFTGIKGIAAQDGGIQESEGPIYDRSNEHLGSTDAAIIQMRRRLLAMARDIQEGRDVPAPEPESYRVRSVSLVLPRTVSWPEAARDAVVATPGRLSASA
jgi:nitrite reductase/ring-hydroxylating ferredoxin subunit